MVQRVIRVVRRSIVGVFVAGAALGAVFVVGMRTKSPGVQRAVRRVNKAFWNPRTMRTAGEPGASASVVHHVGRRSGREYETPVVPVTTGDGFVIALPYGTRADWVQNVLAAGTARVTHEGVTYQAERPEVVPSEQVEGHFDDSERAAHRAFRVEECLRLRRVDGAGQPAS